MTIHRQLYNNPTDLSSNCKFTKIQINYNLFIIKVSMLNDETFGHNKGRRIGRPCIID